MSTSAFKTQTAFPVNGGPGARPLRPSTIVVGAQLSRPSIRWKHALIDACCGTIARAGIIRVYLQVLAFTDLAAVLHHKDLPTPLELLLLVVLSFFFLEHAGLYDAHRCVGGNDARKIVTSVTLSSGIVAAFMFLSGATAFNGAALGAVALLDAAACIGWRFVYSEVLKRRQHEGKHLRHVLIVGANGTGEQLARRLERHKEWGYRVCGFVDASDASGPRMLGKLDDLARIAHSEFVDEVFITGPLTDDLIDKVTSQAAAHNFGVHAVAGADACLWDMPVSYLGGAPVFTLLDKPQAVAARALKRLIDIIVSSAALILLSPLLALIAILIKLETPGPVLHRSFRAGKKGHPFVFDKFRSMVANAEELKEQLRTLNERKGMLFKVRKDPRVTRVGRVLRKYSLDELPQFWNVLIGDMSLVGPRPPTLDEFHQYTSEHLQRLSVAPGLTGLWQVTARQDPAFETALSLDLFYIRKWSLWLDLKILLLTIPAVLNGTGC